MWNEELDCFMCDCPAFEYRQEHACVYGDYLSSIGIDETIFSKICSKSLPLTSVFGEILVD